jgi:hypothetical protein
MSGHAVEPEWASPLGCEPPAEGDAWLVAECMSLPACSVIVEPECPASAWCMVDPTWWVARLLTSSREPAVGTQPPFSKLLSARRPSAGTAVGRQPPTSGSKMTESQMTNRPSARHPPASEWRDARLPVPRQRPRSQPPTSLSLGLANSEGCCGRCEEPAGTGLERRAEVAEAIHLSSREVASPRST